MFVRFTGGGIGHQNTALATGIFREALLKLFGLTFNNDASNDHCVDQDINDPTGNDGEIFEDGHGRPGDGLEDDESEDTQSDIDNDNDVESTDFEGDGGECGADKEDELGFGSF
jgi:hypothetical protein